MKISAKQTVLSGSIQVPGSKSHTIRALLLATLARGTSRIKNPLPSADCLSTSRAVPLLGAKILLDENSRDVGQTWTVEGAGEKIHLPSDVVNVGNSGSLLYFLSPVASTFRGWSIFTGDESIRKRPVTHVVDALNQLGATCCTSIPGGESCPMLIKGAISTEKILQTGGELSQYISGLMMAATRMDGVLKMHLSNPKETPYLTMTKKWLESLGVHSEISDDFKRIQVFGGKKIDAFDKTIPSDWEAVAFPMIAAILTDSEIEILNVDTSGTQGDEAIVEVLKNLGADIQLDEKNSSLIVRGGKKSRDGIGRLSTENFSLGELHVNLSGYPDAVCALAVAACFTEGKIVIEDIGVCRKKETDRISVLKSELEKLGAEIQEGEDSLTIFGHSPVLKDGSENPEFALHGGTVESFLDHRAAMSFACLGLGLKNGAEVLVNDAECCSVSFPNFFETMNSIGANFAEKK
jgi:3-phosphoshikimate 1-carboxyvinyltransferase